MHFATRLHSKINTYFLGVLAFLAMVAAPVVLEARPTTAPTITFIKVADTNTPIPGGSGRSFGWFGFPPTPVQLLPSVSPALSDGRVAFSTAPPWGWLRSGLPQFCDSVEHPSPRSRPLHHFRFQSFADLLILAVESQ